MTTFSDIHSNALGYRNDLNKLNELVLKVAEEKAKGEPLITWFRLRNRRIAQVLNPMQEELKTRSKEEKRKVASISQCFFSLKRVKTLVTSQQYDQANRILNESVEIILDETIHLSKDTDRSIDQINMIEQRLKSERVKSTNNINYYASAEKNVDRVKDLFSSTRTTKEIDIPAFEEAIHSINTQIKTLDINVPELKQLPATYDKQVINSLHEEIRSVVQSIDSRYTMKLFSKSIRTIRIIIHDVGNDRGKRAFKNRSNELLTYTNEAVETFNTKYWQITGQRWERVGRNQWGYRGVKPTHQKISLI